MEVRSDIKFRQIFPRERNPLPIGKEAGWTSQPVSTFWRIEKSIFLSRDFSPELFNHLV
jgi:hypothetical protein